MKEEEIIICECASFDHQAIFYNLKDDNYEVMYVSFHLTSYRNIFKRLRYAIKYILGYKSRYGAWDEFLMGDKQKEQLTNYLNSLSMFGVEDLNELKKTNKELTDDFLKRTISMLDPQPREEVEQKNKKKGSGK